MPECVCKIKDPISLEGRCLICKGRAKDKGS